ncbi:PD-(D/E)XK nuclease superfamily protein [Hymenobacter daecheongensis DSM 21074]|uniref:PD-(D/E)XK nuclease superfamily protein n=1 Tax=Hymenobacter daecheongensis DSM 21074 TaxID=1121955 RepID=A0A1M6J2R1_9BACT|nr:PD-(D/E)XK nuclease family protein [Hymenobacter daecheongensis]SHJ40975.1 PD-(D/E)XK nuclease superfamily protein [Hymenobacter daecheongensis DSM 21074]
MNNLTACLNAVASTVSRVDQENRLVNQYTARDFTPFRFLSGWGEVPSTHMLAFFLDPNEDHGQGTLFQELFIKRLQLQPAVGARLPKTRWKVEAERRHAEYGQLDMLLTAADHSFGICLENKPRNQTIDQPQQLASYRKLLQHRHNESYLLVYLSREERAPNSDSLHPDDRKALTSSGHYINITYRSFILDLLHDWHQAVHPESLRIFLRQFRQHIEQWLQFESTKPAQLMQEQEVAATLATSAANVRTAFEIHASIGALRQQLLSRLTQGLVAAVPGTVGAEHWKYKGFFGAETYRGFLIRRPSPTGIFDDLPWGRYAIVLEFLDGKLMYGVRFDRIDWHQGDTGASAPWPNEISAAMSPGPIPVPFNSNEWWPWKVYASQENGNDLYPAIADTDSDLWKKLKPEVIRLAEALDTWCAIPANN